MTSQAGPAEEAVMAAHRAHGRGGGYAAADFSAIRRGAGGHHRAAVRRRRRWPGIAACLATLSVASGVTLLVPAAQAADADPGAAPAMLSAMPQSGPVVAIALIVTGAATFVITRSRRLRGCRNPGSHL